jgi:hypothetical protein
MYWSLRHPGNIDIKNISQGFVMGHYITATNMIVTCHRMKGNTVLFLNHALYGQFAWINGAVRDPYYTVSFIVEKCRF